MPLHADSVDPLVGLLLATGQGDAAAFADLYDATSARVHGLVQRVLRDAHQGEEVTQEVYLQVWQTASRFDPERGTALSWILTLAHRRAVDRVRSSDAARRRDEGYAQRTHETPYDETAASVVGSMEAETVRAALATLSTPQRRALELAYFDGHTHPEVAHLLQIPLGTAKSRIRDGLIRLRDAVASPTAEPA